mmetsp:Transcript_2344/g.3165  ORF Transcript_2344/g.3165 Transcript_2344/m.3165 type:complete len:348 (+) Transcript_2344:27-1070(+)|eukprot:CAMPEP_0175095660 /NCGR_PEP_ID=MMETSP0086_2-20121207/4286_1 /TAXON_ID=136419 /ORGANISM="Unknown Unknown, Strain D1" /LENGTH=347 /DNA_ID=CAMNT_0016368947 /DNA_START=27 /DNA_END=1070 /DNA_ORIENTATION=+
MASQGKDTNPGRDDIFAYDSKAVEKMRTDKPWTNNVKYFNTCNISTLAAMKMLKHSLEGVRKGRASQNQTPVEVMGLLVGKANGREIVVFDALPLPVEGIETSVTAGESVLGYMTQLSDMLEDRRDEGFVGWYHSHPFDVETKPMYFMSQTDVGTQYGYQNMSPTWTAIVVDPLRSLAKQEPQLGVFRCYPAAHNPPANEGPDGNKGDEAALKERWGHVYNRYYMLEHSFFMSQLGNQFLDIMSRNNLWVRVLSSSSVMEQENRERCAERILKATDSIGGPALARGVGRRRGGAGGDETGQTKLSESALACSELAVEQCCGHISQVSKNLVFNYLVAQKSQQEENKQ